MVGVSQEVVGLIYGLLPGFVAAWVFYGLTAHRKQSPFERVVHALILTAIIRAFVLPTESLFCTIGTVPRLRIGEWTDNVEFFWGVVWAVILGHVLAWVANRNAYHSWLDKWGLTRRTSYPSNWNSAFSRQKRDVILHLEGGRRIMGWPFEWPDQPDEGHFSLEKPIWLLDDNTQVPVLVDELMLIPANTVEFVEFLKYGDEIKGKEEEIAESDRLLTAFHKVNVKAEASDPSGDE